MPRKSSNKPFEFLLYKTDRLHFSVCVYCNRSQKTSQRVKNNSHATRLRLVSYFFVSLHAVTSSVIYHSTHTRKNASHLLNHSAWMCLMNTEYPNPQVIPCDNSKDMQDFPISHYAVWCHSYDHLHNKQILKGKWNETFCLKKTLLFERTFEFIKTGLYSSRVPNFILEIFGFVCHVNDSTAYVTLHNDFLGNRVYI